MKGLAHLNGFSNTGTGSFFETTAYLGIRFEGEDGTHYGYVQLNGRSIWNFEILSYAYESEPNSPILTGAIPEPTSALFLMMLPGFVWRRTRPRHRS